MRSSPSALLDALFLAPPAAKRVAFLSARPFAHRGLHGGSVPENSRAAFAAAIAAGHGIECDVRASADGEAFVFHDDTLDRLTLAQGRFAERSARELDDIRLAGSDERLPRLDAMLMLVAARVPLLIEVKAPDRKVAGLCLAVRRALEGYRGAVAVMSFNPLVGHWFAAHAPRIARGLVVSEDGRPRDLRGRVRRGLAAWRGRPDFLAYDVRDLPSRFAATARGRGLPVLAWTVRDAAAERAALAHADQIIFERAA